MTTMALEDLRTAAAVHRAAVERWETDRAALILAAREDGATWPAVAEAAGMSQAQVRNIAALAEARRR